MAIKAKHGFGSIEKIQQAITAGRLDQYDIVFVDDGRIGFIDRDGQLVMSEAKVQIVTALPTSGDTSVLYVCGGKGYIYTGASFVEVFVNAETSSQITTLDTRITNLTSSVAATNAALTAKVDSFDDDITAVNNSIGEVSNIMNGRIVNLTSLINQKANSSEVYIKSEVDALVNGGIYDDTALWTAVDNKISANNIQEGADDGTISVSGRDVYVHGLASGAYTAVDYVGITPGSSNLALSGKVYDYVNQKLTMSGGQTIQTLLDGKVDKVTGKQLSTNDYTSADKAKVQTALQKADIETGTVDGCIKVQGSNVLVNGLKEGAYAQIATATNSPNTTLPTMQIMKEYVEGKDYATEAYTNTYDFEMENGKVTITRPNGTKQTIDPADIISASHFGTVADGRITVPVITPGTAYGLGTPASTLIDGQDQVCVEVLVSGTNITGCPVEIKVFAYGEVKKTVTQYMPAVGTIVDYPLYVWFYPDYGTHGIYNCEVTFGDGIGNSSAKLNIFATKLA